VPTFKLLKISQFCCLSYNIALFFKIKKCLNKCYQVQSVRRNKNKYQALNCNSYPVRKQPHHINGPISLKCQMTPIDYDEEFPPFGELAIRLFACQKATGRHTESQRCPSDFPSPLGCLPPSKLGTRHLAVS